jgi:hypothetical protein
MAEPRMKFAQLDEARLSDLRAFEKQLGTCVVALGQKSRFAPLSDKQLKQLQAKEKDWDVVLLAYECT